MVALVLFQLGAVVLILLANRYRLSSAGLPPTSSLRLKTPGRRSFQGDADQLLRTTATLASE
jgi:hypothetical protein